MLEVRTDRNKFIRIYPYTDTIHTGQVACPGIVYGRASKSDLLTGSPENVLVGHNKVGPSLYMFIDELIPDYRDSPYAGFPICRTMQILINKI